MNHSHQRGITLIEVLIAMMVMGIGLIGVAAMQTTALSNNQSSMEYAAVAALTQGMVERMRANRDAVIANQYLVASGQPGNPAANCATTTCTSAQQAAWDIASWYLAASSTAYAPAANYGNVGISSRANLGGVRVAITCEATPCNAEDVRVVTLYWDSRRRNATGTGCDPMNEADLACFRLPFVP